jgi:hypothetical protein
LGIAPGGYLLFLLGMMMVGCSIMRKAKVRWPQLGTFGLITVSFGFFFVFDFIAEQVCVRLGFFAYPGGISWLTVFHGHHYQFPVYVSLIGGIFFTAFTSLRYFRNDKGETLAEHGLSEWALPARARSVVRLLAIIGACNVAFLAANIPWMTLSMYQSPWPDDITQRSYLMDGVCGPHTDYACPGPQVPIPRPHSAHLDPDGHLVFP